MKDNTHADDESDGYLDFQETGKYDADAAHLSGNVGKGNKDQAYDRDDARSLRIITLGNKLGHGELAELSQVGREKQGQQDIATGPAHQINGAVITEECDEPGHRDE